MFNDIRSYLKMRKRLHPDRAERNWKTHLMYFNGECSERFAMRYVDGAHAALHLIDCFPDKFPREWVERLIEKEPHEGWAKGMVFRHGSSKEWFKRVIGKDYKLIPGDAFYDLGVDTQAEVEAILSKR